MSGIIKIIIIFLIILFQGYSQNQFRLSIGGTGDDRANAIIKTTDGGFAIAGYSNSFRSWKDYYIVKLDGTNSLQWTRAIENGISNSLQAYSIVQTPDGGYCVAGYIWIYSGSSYYDVYLAKLDAGGMLQWSKAMNLTLNDWTRSIIRTVDNGFALIGETNAYGSPTDLFILKIDSAGNFQWNKIIGGTNFDYGYSIVQTSDGGYAAAGFTQSFGAGSNDFFIVKVNSTGTLQWTKVIGGNNEDDAYSIIQTSDGGLAVAGITHSFGTGHDIYLVKLDVNGNFVWSRTIGSNTSSFFAYSVIQSSDGGFTVAGSIISNGTLGYQVYLLKLDANGNFIWNKSYGTGRNNGAYSLVQTSDGGYAVAGYTTTDTSGSVGNFYIIKTDANGNTCGNISNPVTLWSTGSNIISPAPIVNTPSSSVTTPTVTLISGGSLTTNCLTGIQPISNEIPGEFKLYQNYPNPFNPVTHVGFRISNFGFVNLIIYDALGKEVTTLINEKLTPGVYEIEWDGSNYPSGVYYYALSGGDFSSTGKAVLIK